MENQIKYPKFFLLSLVMLISLSMTAMATSDKMGDVDDNGFVNVADVTLLISHVLGNECDINEWAADINADGLLNVADVTGIIRMILDPGSQIDKVTITANGVSFTMVYVPGGTFMMGSTPATDPDAYRNESPVHEVTVWSYYIAETEVTQELWQAVMGNNPSKCQGDPRRPVENVTLFQCVRFVDKLSALTGKVFRLPTEAEWEYAARGAGYSRGFRFAGSADVDLVAWYYENALDSPHPVGLKQPNEIGLYDMSGNVFEWCQDFYSSYDGEPAVNPIGPESGSDNIIRGGSWGSMAPLCRVSFRGMMPPSESTGYVGLRLAMNY